MGIRENTVEVRRFPKLTCCFPNPTRNGEQGKEYRHLQKDRKTPTKRIKLVLGVELLHLVTLTHGIIGVLGLDFL